MHYSSMCIDCYAELRRAMKVEAPATDGLGAERDAWGRRLWDSAPRGRSWDEQSPEWRAQFVADAESIASQFGVPIAAENVAARLRAADSLAEAVHAYRNDGFLSRRWSDVATALSNYDAARGDGG